MRLAARRAGRSSRDQVRSHAREARVGVGRHEPVALGGGIVPSARLAEGEDDPDDELARVCARSGARPPAR